SNTFFTWVMTPTAITIIILLSLISILLGVIITGLWLFKKGMEEKYEQLAKQIAKNNTDIAKIYTRLENHEVRIEHIEKDNAA
ncbi:unnamed protein product, partial [marine sediment metagenome]